MGIVQYANFLLLFFGRVLDCGTVFVCVWRERRESVGEKTYSKVEHAYCGLALDVFALCYFGKSIDLSRRNENVS